MKLSTLNGKLKLFSVSTNAKTAKSDATGESYTAICYLAPSDVSGYEVCPNASDNCRKVCLGWYAGRSTFSNVQKARIAKTLLYAEHRDTFINTIKEDLKIFQSFCEEHNRKGYVRLNGSSDIKVEDLGVIQAFPSLHFYDYTKRTDRDFANLPSNYSLTFSRDERTTPEEIARLIPIVNVAVVFKEIPSTYMGYTVINGDETDLRAEDPRGVIVGLKAKGAAKKDTSGFVVVENNDHLLPTMNNGNTL